MFALCIALSIVAAVQGQGTASHQPAFFWGTQLLSDAGSRVHQTEFLREATTSDLERTVDAIVGTPITPSAKGSPLFDGRPATSPEVQLVFLAEGITTDAVRAHGSKLPALKALLEKSPASLSVPFTLTSSQARAFPDASVRVTGAEVENYLKDHIELFSNGVPDVIVVELASMGEGIENMLSAHDALVGRVARAVHSGTKGNYAALLTGSHGARGAHRMLSPQVSPVYLHTTPTLLTAQVVCLMLFVIFISGFCCLFSLQTPKKFEEVKSA